MQDISIYVKLLFIITTVITVFLFAKSSKKFVMVLSVLVGWCVIQSIIALSGFYLVTDVIPPRFLLMVLPPLAVVFIMFLTKSGRTFIDSLDIKTLTILHTIRIPVELVLYFLCAYKVVPQLMTFEGRNFDIISGLTAPFVFLFCFNSATWAKKVLLIWNFICLVLLINIVVHAILSAPFPFQQMAFDQPNIAVLYFPFNLLPAVVVPLVLFSHLVSIRKLLIK